MESQVSNNKAESGSQVDHKWITRVSQVRNNKATNDSQMGIVTQKWRTPDWSVSIISVTNG